MSFVYFIFCSAVKCQPVSSEMSAVSRLLFPAPIWVGGGGGGGGERDGCHFRIIIVPVTVRFCGSTISFLPSDLRRR